MTRADTLWKLAELHPLIVDALNGPAFVSGDGGSWPHTDPTSYTATVREFERLCRRMRSEGSQLAPIYAVMPTPTAEWWRPVDRDEYLAERRADGGRAVLKLPVATAYWHLNEYWLKAVRVPYHTRVPVKRGRTKAPKGQRILKDREGRWVPSRAEVRVLRHPDADRLKARLAVEWMARPEQWTCGFKPRIPVSVVVPRVAA